MWDRRWLLGFGLALGAVLGAPSPGSAGVLEASGTAPTTNTDGRPLINLESYRVFLSRLLRGLGLCVPGQDLRSSSFLDFDPVR